LIELICEAYSQLTIDRLENKAMTPKPIRAIRMAAVIFAFAVTQIYVAPGFANRPANDKTPIAGTPGQQVTGVLTTHDNKPILVNGAGTATGATILNGALVETPDGVSASINIPGHGVVEIAPSTKLTFEIDAAGNILVKVMQGCATLRSLKGTKGELDNPQGVVGRTDGSKNDSVGQCPGVKTVGAATGGGGGLFGLGTGGTIAIIGAGIGTATALALAGRSSNPSNSGL